MIPLLLSSVFVKSWVQTVKLFQRIHLTTYFIEVAFTYAKEDMSETILLLEAYEQKE